MRTIEILNWRSRLAAHGQMWMIVLLVRRVMCYKLPMRATQQPSGSTTTTFRLSELDQDHLTWLAEDLSISRSDVVRHGLAALRLDAALRDLIRLEQRVVGLLDRLRSNHGADSMLRFLVAPEHPDPNVRIVTRGRQRVEMELDGVTAEVRYLGDRAFLDLIDPETGAGIRSAYEAEVRDGGADVHIPLRALNLYRRAVPVTEPVKSEADGRTLMTFLLDRGTFGVMLDQHDRARLIPQDQRAEQFAPKGHPA